MDKSFPIIFFQDRNLCLEAIALGGYLHSIDENLNIYPELVKKNLGFGKKRWDKACRNLREQGYMKLSRGGLAKGSHYKFSITKQFK